MWDEWSVADTVDAELVEAQEVICLVIDGQESAAEVVTSVINPDGSVTITADCDLDMERVEETFQWDDQIRVLVRDYSGVEV